MAKVRVQRTARGNVKIVLDRTSALKLARILNWSDAIGDGECTVAEREYAAGQVEDLSRELHKALIAARVYHEDL